jgi:hypothetical protein
MNKWNYIKHKEDDPWPTIGSKIYCKTNQGDYVAHVDKHTDIIFDQAIHFNGEISVPPISLHAWKYISDEVYNELRGFEIVE